MDRDKTIKEEEAYYPDEIFGNRLMISLKADITELKSNIRAA